MTKKDTRALTIAGGLGLGGFLVFWFFLRPRLTIRELNPTQVKWANP